MTDYREFIFDTLNKAAQLADSFHGNVKTISKKKDDNNQVLTEADLAVGKLLIEEIDKHYPDFNVIDEEAGVIDKKSKYTWVTDPIDGTANFAVGLPMYGVMIGLLEEDKPIAGGIALPAVGKTLIAQSGQGTELNGEKISVDKKSPFKDSLIVYMIDAHPENPEITKQETNLLSEMILKMQNYRTSGSAYDFLAVATGAYGGAVNQTSKIWDYVAVQPVIEEAGGIYTDFWGNPMNYSDPLSRADENFTFCLGAPQIHEELQKIIHSR